MSIEHDNLPANPRLESLLREIVAAGDLQPAQNQRVRTRLGLDPQPIASMATPSLTLPDTRAATNLVPTAVQEESPTIATSRHRLRQQWFQFALAGAAFIAVGVLLALVFGSGNDEPAAQPGTTGTPEATATTATANPELAVRDALEPLPSGQERRLILEVEAHNQHDNAFDRWTIELWQHWSAADVLSEGLYVSDPAGEVVTHIALNGQQPLLNWEPRDGLFDVPLEYSLQRRVLGATLAAVNDPDAHALRSEERDGLVVLHFEWRDNYAEEFDYISRGEAWIDPGTGQLQRIVHLVDRPEQEPYPTRTFAIRAMEVLPAGSSPAGAYEIAGATPPGDATASPSLPTPDETGAYTGITFEQAQAIVPFEIRMPERIPDGLDTPGIMVVESPPLEVGGRVYRVEMLFELSGDETPGQAVQFTQILSSGSGDWNMPNAKPPFIFTATSADGALVTVSRVTGSNADGDPLLAYWWELDGVSYQIFAAPEGDLTPGLVEDLMHAILGPPTQTTEDQTALLERERAEMIPVPVPDSCNVSTWAGPDFRVSQQYAAAYFLDGDGLTLGTTHGLLFSGENEITWFADAPLTTVEALSGPETIRAVQSDGDGSTFEIPIEVIEQINGGGRDDSVERAWWSTVSFPSEGCWNISVTLGVHSLTATVYVYSQDAGSMAR